MDPTASSPEQTGRKFASGQIDSLVGLLLGRTHSRPRGEPTLALAAAPPWRVPLHVSLAFHEAAWDDASPAERDKVARLVFNHHEQLEAHLSDRARYRSQSVDEKRETFHDLVYQVALVLIPCYAHLGRYPQAARLTRLLFGLSRSRTFREVRGAGSRGEPIESRHLLMTVVMWALACHFPSAPRQEA